MVNIPAMHSTTVVSGRPVAIVLARTMAIEVSRSAAVDLAVAALAIADRPARASELDPAFSRNRGAALLDTGETKRAMEVFRDLVRRLPGSGPDRVNLGIAL